MRTKIIPIIENIPHKTYVEPFGGGASILIGKRPQGIEVYNDIDETLYNFFKVISNPETFEVFYRRVEALPYHRKLWYDYREAYKQETDPIEKAVKWFVIMRQCLGGIRDAGWGYSVTTKRRGMASTISLWLTAIDKLPEIHKRLQRVQFECRDFRKIFELYDTPETLFYCDPPYVESTRKQRGYDYEMTDNDHKDLIDILLNCRGSVVLSGYNNDLYNNKLIGNSWLKKEYKTACHASVRNRNSNLQGEGSALKNAPRIEVLWIKQSGSINELEFL